jgi:hypothetical protein
MTIHYSHEVTGSQRTEKGLAFDRFQKQLTRIAGSKDPEIATEWREQNEEILSQKASSSTILHTYVLSNLSVQYANDAFIGTRLMPVININGRLAASYYSYGKRDRLAYPDDTMADRSNANELNRTRTLANISLTPRALREYVDELTLNNPEQPLNELVEASNNVLNGIAFKQEQRIAGVVAAAANYGSNTSALAPADRWDVGGDPVGDIIGMIPNIWNGVAGNAKRVGFMSLTVWNVLRKHPRILDLFKFNGSSPGLASTDMLKGWFDLDELLIGSAWQDSSNEGQAQSISRTIWPDVFGIVTVAAAPSLRSVQWGATFQDRAAPEIDTTYTPERGTDGGWYARAKVSDVSAIIASDAGFLLTTPIG